MKIPAGELIAAAESTLSVIRTETIGIFKYEKEDACRKIYSLASKEKKKTQSAFFDRFLETKTKTLLKEKLSKYDIIPFGEETLKDNPSIEKKVRKHKGTAVLLDMMDGSDLLERNLSNWCSAMIFYMPSNKSILGAFIGDPLGQVYYALSSDNKAYKIIPKTNKEKKIIKEIKPSNTTELKKASLCFYGQKHKNYKSFLEQSEILKAVYRIYNFGGNPMLVKLADSDVQVVIELLGQQAHDAAPGLFIAQKSGAAVTDLNGNKIDLISYMLYPRRNNLNYIVASTAVLHKKICRKI